jgi:hypothetical protein
MSKKASDITLQEITRCIETLDLAIKGFKEFLGDKTSSGPANYDDARKYLEEGKAFYEEARDEFRKLLGPLPMDVSPSFKDWKGSFLKRIGILMENKELFALKSELQHDEFLLRFLTQEEIGVLFISHYESQKQGKRRLSNIKARIILDEAEKLINEAEELEKISKEKMYQHR